MYDFYAVLTQLISAFIDFYVDLFLLWLLYKFMRPHIILNDGKTEASALMFSHAHNSKIVEESEI